MLCCFDGFGDPSKAYNRQTNDGGVSSFPGQRRYHATGGNALSAAPPQSSFPPQQSSFPSQAQHPTSGGGDMIAVTVPHGVQPGQTIQVNSPDGRAIHAQVPQGMGPGSQFMVSMPPRTVTPPPAVPVVQNTQDYSNLQPMAPPSEPFVPPLPAKSTTPGATTIPASNVRSEPIAVATPYVPQATPIMAHAAPPPVQPAPAAPTTNQKLMLVQVPPGMQPGSTIHVQVPGENRTLAAQIPPGVSEFHVAYQPTAAPQQPPAQKVLLVRVPPGTPPGTVLHVSIPDEPGRMIGATVPPNVSEFHVSYAPGNNNNNNASNVNNQGFGNNNNNRGFNNNGGYNNNQRNNGGYNNNQRNNGGYNNNHRNSRNSGGLGGMVLPLLGGAALGAAGLGILGHHNHNQQDQQQYDNDNYQDGGNQDGGYQDGGDYGGGDYGGGDYGGGDDYGGGGDFGGFGDY